MSYLEELLPEFRKGAKIRRKSWQENFCISLNDCCGINIPYYDVEADDWEPYQEPIDWQYIIDNEILCWFWDCNPDFVIHLGHLTRLMPNCPNNEEFNYCKDNGKAFKNCRPVRRDEVTFYEDRKDGDY